VVNDVLTEQPFDEQPLDEQTVSEQPFDEQPLDEQTFTGSSLEEQPRAERVMHRQTQTRLPESGYAGVKAASPVNNITWTNILTEGRTG